MQVAVNGVQKIPLLYNRSGSSKLLQRQRRYVHMDNNSLAHSRYNCTYHIVFILKYRRKVMFGELRKDVGEILGRVCKKESRF